MDTRIDKAEEDPVILDVDASCTKAGILSREPKAESRKPPRAESVGTSTKSYVPS